MRFRLPVPHVAPLLLLSLVVSACGDDDTTPTNTPDAGLDGGDTNTPDADPDASTDTDLTDVPPNDTTDTDTDETTPDVTPDGSGDTSDDTTDTDPPLPTRGDCEPLDPGVCALPWPSDFYLVEDDTTPSGLRVDFGAASLPATRSRRHIQPAPYATLDGFGWGPPIMALLTGADTAALAGEETIDRSLEADSNSLLFAVTDEGLVRVPHWVERDAQVTDETRAVLYMRPAVVLEPQTRYIVAYRNLEDDAGTPLAASDAFAALRDNTPSEDPDVEARRAHFEELFADLEAAGVARDALTLAWDFTTGSEENLHRYLDQAIEVALEAMPTGATFVSTGANAYLPETDGTDADVNPYVAYSAFARMTVPSVVRPRPTIGTQINLDEDGNVARYETDTVVDISIQIPHRAAAGEPVGVIVYGHGLLGNPYEIEFNQYRQIAQAMGYIFVACPLTGMAEGDQLNVLAITGDLSNFVTLADGLIQGLVQYHMLARSASGTLIPYLQEIDPDITIDTDRIHYVGASQGGIFGGTFLATSPDIDRGILIVPGNNYSTMLQRSVNFAPFFDQLGGAYRDTAELAVGIAAVQLLWDRTDPISYFRRMIERDQAALFLVSKSDYQVPVVTNEVVSRTYAELPLMDPWAVDRTPWGISQQAYPHTGSGMVLFDFGNPWPTERYNRPPIVDGPDPHSRLNEVPEAAGLFSQWLTDLTIIDVCGGDGCTPN